MTESIQVDAPLLDCLKTAIAAFPKDLATRPEEVDTGVVKQIISYQKEITALLTANHRFHGQPMRVLASGGGEIPLVPLTIARPIMLKAIRHQSAEKALKWLDELLAVGAGVERLILTVWGVPVRSRVQLTELIALVPLTDLPAEEIRFLNEAKPSSERFPSSFSFQPPESALVHSRARTDIVRPHDPDRLPDLSFSKHIEELYQLADVLSLIGPRFVLPGWYWFSYEDSELNFATSRAVQHNEIMPQGTFGANAALGEEAAEFVSSFYRMSLSDKALLRVAASRINIAMRRHRPADKAVELATACESLFGDEGNTEMTHKVCVRIVRTVGGLIEERQRNAAILKASYAFRSKLLHRGSINETKTKSFGGPQLSPGEIVEEALKITSAAIREIVVTRKAVPKWSEFDYQG